MEIDDSLESTVKVFRRKFWIIHTFQDMQSFIVGAIGMVQEPQHLVNGSTYFCGVEGICILSLENGAQR
ncbi:hypothetical protein V6N13_030164 [Hibiscus sabdariffa]